MTDIEIAKSVELKKITEIAQAIDITEDELERDEDAIQKLTDKYIDQIDKILADKEKEVMSV